VVPEIQEVIPKYLQIAGYIRDQIVRGDLRPGDDVPSEREIAAMWGVARPTAARALEALRVQGLVESRRGSGTYVREAKGAPRARERYERARDLGTMYSPAESVEFLTTELVPGPQHVVDALQLPAGSDVVCRARLLRAEGGQPIELSTSWFAPQLAQQAPRLLEPKRLFGGTAKYLAEVAGRQAAYARDQVAARLATAEEGRLLELASPAAVLVYRLTVYDPVDAPIQFDDATYPPERWAFRQEYPLSR
jgi:DNA-binding GntR family transcriptional regulator